jgi:hypothetical protein
MTAVGKLRFAVWATAFITAVAGFSYLTSRLAHPASHTWVEQFESPAGWTMGALFLLIGLFLFDRYAEE